ncbi:hypothetical protein AB0E83_24765 [Streptomyces sp. NPDC035033]|uniref:hypothetical protein n=1 Tax=Streptomyces sp. NPDC035033 TaxID=3155368 RepID=UPI0033CAD75B
MAYHFSPRRERLNAVLVVGDTSTPDGLADVTALAHEVAVRMQVPAVIAMGRDYDVRAYDTLVYDEGSYLENVDAAVLWAEASSDEADMAVMNLDDLESFDFMVVCGWCGEPDEDDPMPTLVEGVWIPAEFCGGCLNEARRQGRVDA